jgi:hypothetical protein
MTPKEKALELFETYLKELVKYDFDTNDQYSQPYNEIAKQCALIAVEFSKEFITGDLSEAFDKFLYIQEVKEEIEKL